MKYSLKIIDYLISTNKGLEKIHLFIFKFEFFDTTDFDRHFLFQVSICFVSVTCFSANRYGKFNRGPFF